MAQKSRAEYMKERRKTTRAFYVDIDADKMERFEKKLSEEDKTKKEWLNIQIDEYIGK